MNKIKELRKEKGITQTEASEITDIPLRTYKVYENDLSKVGSIKYNHIVRELEKYGYIDEENGTLKLDRSDMLPPLYRSGGFSFEVGIPTRQFELSPRAPRFL